MIKRKCFEIKKKYYFGSISPFISLISVIIFDIYQSFYFRRRISQIPGITFGGMFPIDDLIDTSFLLIRAATRLSPGPDSSSV